MIEDRRPICPFCRKPMKLFRTLPMLGVLPPLHVFHCVSCNHTTTKEEKPPRAEQRKEKAAQ
jgi:hypothetical protein